MRNRMIIIEKSFWKKNLEGPVVKVRVAHKKLITPAEIRVANGMFWIN